MEWLGIEAAPHVARFMKALFVVSLEDFFPDGALYGVLGIVTAALVMHHKQLSQDFAGSQYVIVDLMVKAAREASIVDMQCATPTDPAGVLEYWSDVIEENFKEQNLPQTIDPSVHTLLAVIQEQKTLTQTVIAQSQTMKDELASIRRGQQTHGNILEQVRLYFSTYFCTPTRKRKSPPVDLAPQPGQPAGGSLEVYPDSPSIRVLEQAGPSTPFRQPMLEQPQSPGVDDAAVAPGGGAIGEASPEQDESQQGFGSVQPFNSAAMEVVTASAKGVTVQKVLLDMFQSGSFLCWGSDKMEDLALPLYIGREAAKMRNVLELVGLIVTPEEKTCLADKSSSLEAVKHVCQDLENKADGRSPISLD
jgi:hypothetical protein